MPIYEYRCAECGAEKEILQKISDAPLKDCPECGKPAMSKLVSAAGFQLKGTGWYVTDFRDKPKPAAKADKPADSKPADGASRDSAKPDTSAAASASAPASAPKTTTEKV